jgi:chromosome segregation ATPase
MVQTDISQISGECNTWREKLRNYREEFTLDENRLRQVAGQTLSKEQLQDVEHLHNQFHIQLINIHDLKQAIKNHDRQVNLELTGNNSITEDSLAKHESLHTELQSLEQTLGDLRSEFKQFLQRTS